MFELLVESNDDLKRLVERGYAVGFDSNCLIVRDIPYIDNEQKLHKGAIVTKLVFADQIKIAQEDHQIFFAGAVPHNIDGKPVPNLGGGECQLLLTEDCTDVVVQRSFSSKPTFAGKYLDFFEKVEAYVAMISGPAMALHDVHPYTFRTVKNVKADSVFKFQDTLTSRAEIADLTKKLKNDKIAIIGLGGTGAYILDFLAKTAVQEIRTFDFDEFHVHNAYRSPGKLDPLEFRKMKTQVYHSRYENFRSGLSFHSKLIDATCSEDLDGVTFAFVCVDKGSSRSGIFDLLLLKKIPFIDVGMGLNRKSNVINGMLRTTYYPLEDGQKIRDMNLAPLQDRPDDLYKTNIQISELNALNASLAVLKFKQVRGFYAEESPLYHLLFEIADLKVVGNSEIQ